MSLFYISKPPLARLVPPRHPVGQLCGKGRRKAAGFSRSSFDRAVAINPLDWRPHHQLALQTYRATDFARSAVHWQEAVVRRPTMAELHEGLGDTLCLIVSRL